MKWAQDTLITPVRASNARQDLNLVNYVADHYSYVFDYGIGSLQPQKRLDFSGQIPLSSDFYMTQIVCCFVGGDGAFTDAFMPVYLTLVDNVTQYTIVNRLNGNAFMPDISETVLNQAAQRTIWPEPYGFGAGGSFHLSVEVQSVGGLPGNIITGQICIEGFKYYQIGGQSYG